MQNIDRFWYHSIGMCQSSSTNGEIMRAMVYEGVSDKRGGDEYGGCE